jgi:hypothetical protein
MAESKDESEDEDQESTRIQVRFRLIWREYYDVRYERSPQEFLSDFASTQERKRTARRNFLPRR